MWQAKALAQEDARLARAEAASRRALMSPDDDHSDEEEEQPELVMAADDDAGPNHVVTGVGGKKRMSAQTGDGPGWLERRMRVIEVKFFQQPGEDLGSEDETLAPLR
jgi:hypothetical protein